MSFLTQNITRVPNRKIQLDFVHLKGKLFAEYNIIYHINDIYSIKKLSQINNKHQLLFQKFTNKIQQLNLVIVDTIFANLLADVALEIFLGKITTFKDYINLEKNFTIISNKKDQVYFKYKFKSFIYYLLYSNIYSDQVCKGEIETDRIYYFKTTSKEIEYYPIFRQNELQELMLEKMILEIDSRKSEISNNNLKLCFKLFTNLMQPKM